MRTLYLVTHPEATHHTEGLVGGWYDSELTPAGARAAVAIAEELRKRIPQTADVELFSSDLKRTVATAEEIAQRFRLTPMLDRRLREKSYGEAEGKAVGSTPGYRPPPAEGDRLHYQDGVRGAETIATFAARAYQAMTEILSRDCEHQILVTHGGTVTFLIASWIKMPPESLGYVNFRAAPGSITVLREDSASHHRRVESLGEVGHLVEIS
ncbi:histidine phosphatase family protein [Psychromicrobium lacuslunae]|uniref:Phosphoglycerate kinase n=1 Tax=Psychromicrobium lacuslunae TaxID=1618207 RepID=A0A0D4C0N5_9MICC|nr:histidine phosphatase family protein [Psychromicrobium lacuslunae]AJT42237.1 phosphoglycerate kinase [Psychromicrobium lacuslunae]